MYSKVVDNPSIFSTLRRRGTEPYWSSNWMLASVQSTKIGKGLMKPDYPYRLSKNICFKWGKRDAKKNLPVGNFTKSVPKHCHLLITSGN